MPEITLDNGQRKKVACGPCIRGHRSTKCQHTDRVLIEVRKPGRPLSACPHPSGSCSCERIVINYTIPKSAASEHECPPVSDAPAPAYSASANRVQKTRSRKSVSNITPSTLERAFNVDPEAFPPNIRPASGTTVSSSTDFTSSNGSSPSSSTSSTPKLQPARSLVQSQDRSTQVLKPQGTQQNEKKPRLKLGMMGIGGFGASPDEIGWSSKWPDPYALDATEHSSGEKPKSMKGCCGETNQEKERPSTKSCCSGGAKSTLPSRNESEVVQQSRVGPDNNAGRQANNYQQASITQPSDVLRTGRSNVEKHAYHTTSVQGDPFDVPNGHTFPHTVLSGPVTPFEQQPCSHMAPTQTKTTSGSHTNGQPSSCTCGDTCACFACAVHPNNETTTKYVLYHHGLEERLAHGNSLHLGSANDQISQSGLAMAYPPHHSTYAPDSQISQAMMGPYNHLLLNNVHGSYQDPARTFTPVAGGNALWQMGPTPGSMQPTPTTELGRLDFQSPRNQFGLSNGTSSHFSSLGDMLTPTNFSDTDFFHYDYLTNDHTADQESAINNDGTTLSPSSFLLQQYVIPGCGDATGTCQCGDGCLCEGCLTHGGHNGIQLDLTSGANQDPHVPGASSASAQGQLNGFSVDFAIGQNPRNGVGYIHNGSGNPYSNPASDMPG